ncbi:putative ribonuclease H-like domain-containing protein [Tanacetum coccineum]
MVMKIGTLFGHTDYPIREVIQNGNGLVLITTDIQGQIKVLPPRTAEEILAREREIKARTTLLMALPEDHLAKFLKMTDDNRMEGYIIGYGQGFSFLNSEDQCLGVVRQSLALMIYIIILEVFESNVQGSTASSSFLAAECGFVQGEGIDWTSHQKKERLYALMAYIVQAIDTEIVLLCGSLSHLIRDCDFHEKRMAKQAELNNRMRKKSSQREIRPIWNNVQRVNHQNQFVPTAVLTRTGKILVNTARHTARASGTNNVSTARHNLNRQAVPSNGARKVNTVKPIVNNAKVNTVKPMLVLLGEKGKLLLSPQQVVIGDQKDITGTKSPNTMVDQDLEIDYPHRTLQNKGIVDSGCSRHMTGNKAYLAEYQDFNGGPVAFGGSKGYITGKGKIKTRKLDFEDVCFVKELQHFNLFSVSQMCDKKNKVLFTDTECLVLSPEFKLPDENQVLLRIPRQNNMYSFNLENIVPSGGLACLIAKATIDESNKWHRRLGHVNFKNLNKLVKGNLVRGLPLKIFQNDHTCVACQKGKQHKASCKAKSVSSISQTLQLLHMDLFGPTSVRSLNHKTYCLVITDDFSRFSWVFFLRTKDETSGILKDFIRQIKNQLNQKVKAIRCDNGTEFKNRDFIEFCGSKGIKRHIISSENQANKQAGPKEANHIVGTKDIIDVGDSKKEDESGQDYFVLPIWSSYSSTVKSSKAKNADNH